MHPGVDEGPPCRAFGLGDLVFMVRELQVEATAVDVEMLTEQGAAHRRALDVPTRATPPELAVPLGVIGLAGLGRFPQHEVQRVLLAVGHRDALACSQFVERLAR